MQPVPDLHLLQLAQPGVELRQGGVRPVLRGDAAVPVQAEPRGEAEDLLAQHPQAPRVHPGGVVVLVHQPFQLRQRAVALRPRQGRGQVVHDHRLRAALGLCALPRVVDDERVDVGHGAERGFREAFRGERQRLARQPFQVPVLAHVHHGVHPCPQPGVEREVAVRGDEGGVVVGRGGIDVVAARRLQPHHDVAEAQRRHRERSATVRFHGGRIASRGGRPLPPTFRSGRLHAGRVATGRPHEERRGAPRGG